MNLSGVKITVNSKALLLRIQDLGEVVKKMGEFF